MSLVQTQATVCLCVNECVNASWSECVRVDPVLPRQHKPVSVAAVLQGDIYGS